MSVSIRAGRVESEVVVVVDAAEVVDIANIAEVVDTVNTAEVVGIVNTVEVVDIANVAKDSAEVEHCLEQKRRLLEPASDVEGMFGSRTEPIPNTQGLSSNKAENQSLVPRSLAKCFRYLGCQR